MSSKKQQQSLESKKEKTQPLFVKLYLTVYNLAACIGWLLVFIKCFNKISKQDYFTIYEDCELELKVAQTMALLEVIHSKGLLGFVGSPWITTFMQVSSRIWTLWAIMVITKDAQTSIFTLLAITSWSMVEIPRYLFYALSLWDACPYPLIWLRYSLFAILYPTGITGELGCMYMAYKSEEIKKYDFFILDTNPIVYVNLAFITLLVVLTYIPGSPFMYMHMVKARSKALNSKPKEE